MQTDHDCKKKKRKKTSTARGREGGRERLSAQMANSPASAERRLERSLVKPCSYQMPTSILRHQKKIRSKDRPTILLLGLIWNQIYSPHKLTLFLHPRRTN